MKIKNHKGFTLIELLVVIAIIAVLAVVVILSLNPAELLRQARDSNRISDMGTIKSSLALYLADQTSPSLASNYGLVYMTTSTAIAINTSSIGFATFGGTTVPAASTSGTGNSTVLRNIDSTGWIPVNFGAISGGSPMPQLPVDPVNGGTGCNVGTSAVSVSSPCYYAYAATSSSGFSYKITMRVESTKFSYTGGSDVVSPDGGLFTSVYEAGTNLKL